MEKSFSESYKAAGVDITAGYQAVELMKAHVGRTMIPGVLGGKHWVYYQSPAFDISEEEARKFDDLLEPWEKKVLPCQEEFYILSHATLS